MADKDYSRTAAVIRDYLTRREMNSGVHLQFVDGDNTNSQTVRLDSHAETLISILQLHDGTTEYKAGDGKELKHVSSLTGEARGFTYDEDGRLITFGNGTNGFKPADTSSKEQYCLAIKYLPARGTKTVSTSLVWTEQAIADNVAPDTDTAIYCDGAEEISILFDTDGATTGSPDFDLDVIASLDGTTYQDATNPLVTAFTAQAKGLDDITAINPGAAQFVKLRLDVNTANLAAAETVNATVKVTWRY